MIYNQPIGRPGGQRRQQDMPRSNTAGDHDQELERLLTPDRTIDYFAGQSCMRPVIRAELLDGEARKVAQDIRKLPAAQLRRFYASVLSLKREIEIDPDKLNDGLIRARLAMLKAHAAYAWKRMEKSMPREFVCFIVRHVASVKTKNDFLFGFAPYFEAVVAYHKFFEEKRGE